MPIYYTIEMLEVLSFCALVVHPWKNLRGSSEAGSYLRLIDFVCHLTLNLRVIKKKRRESLDRPRTASGTCMSIY